MSTRRSLLSVPVLLLLLTGLSVPLAGPAAAAPPTPEKHCVLAAGAKAATCYATFPAAIAAITGGKVRAPASATDAATDPAFAAAVDAPAATAAQTIVGIEYADANYRGSTLTLYASGRCDSSPDADYAWDTLPSGWNDRISSLKSFANCAQQLFRDTYRRNPITGLVYNVPNLGAANDQASSITAN